MTACHACATELPDGARFCLSCGASQAAPACINCGTQLPAGARFCLECGAAQTPGVAPVSAPAPQVARRVTSVLFGDLVGFTTLSESRDQEDVRDLLSAYFEQCRQIIARYPEGRSRSALLPLLHLVQSEQGYVSPEGIAFCAEILGITKAQVGAVATFYTMYKRKPTGDWLVSVCTNTMCGVLGGDKAYEALRDYLGVDHDETTADGKITLEHAECLAACDFAPVLQVNYEYYDNQTVESAEELVDALRRGERPPPTRGAPLTDWRTVSAELAGFFDDLAAEVEGPSAAPETLRGTTIADERGWSTEPMPDDPPLPARPEPKK